MHFVVLAMNTPPFSRQNGFNAHRIPDFPFGRVVQTDFDDSAHWDKTICS